MIQLLLTTTCTARMTADARGGEPRRGESDGTSSISRASDDRGFPRMPGEASRGEVNQTEPHRFPSLRMTVDSRVKAASVSSRPDNTKKILKNTLM